MVNLNPQNSNLIDAFKEIEKIDHLQNVSQQIMNNALKEKERLFINILISLELPKPTEWIKYSKKITKLDYTVYIKDQTVIVISEKIIQRNKVVKKAIHVSFFGNNITFFCCLYTVGKYQSLEALSKQKTITHNLEKYNLLPTHFLSFTTALESSNRLVYKDRVVRINCDGDLYDLEYRLNLVQKLTVFQQILESVSTLHNNNIAHRNLRPEKILIHFHKNFLKVYFSDLKLATEITEESCFEKVGSVPFLPPEFFLKKEIDLKALDMWALGLILYFLFSDTKDDPFINGWTPLLNKSQTLEKELDQKKIDCIQNIYRHGEFINLIQKPKQKTNKELELLSQLTELLHEFLKYDLSKRITVEEAIKKYNTILQTFYLFHHECSTAAN